jgi:phosphonate transport system substrate-binding protein
MTQEAPLSGPGSFGPRRRRTPLAMIRVGLYLLLAGAVGVAVFACYQTLLAKTSLNKSEAQVVIGMGLVEPVEKHLASRYTDHDGRLLADPPTSPAELIDPDTLVVAYAGDVDAENQQVDWKKFCADLAKITGKKVTSRPYQNSVADVAAVRAGKIQIVALHAADTPYLVNTAGFIPVGVLGGAAGPTGNKLDIAVPADSPIHTLTDLKGHTLTCTVPGSITGYRAAVAMLMQEAALRPNVDYLVNFSLGQKKSIKGLVKNEFQATALSDDKVQSLLDDGKLEPTAYRTIYQSQVIPRLTIGYVYNLKPQLAAEIKQEVIDFDNAGGTPDEDGGKPMRFAPVDYKKDFEFVRKVDDAFDPRFNSAAAEKQKSAMAPAAPTTAPSAT